MNKTLMLIMVLGLAVLSGDGIVAASGSVAPESNVSIAMFPNIVFNMPNDNGLICVVYIEVTDVTGPAKVSGPALANITTQLPDAVTIMLLGLGGLLYRRRKQQ